MSQRAYTKILDFIERNDKEIYEIVERLCLNSIFNIKRHNGITFLLPADKKFRQELQEKSTSEDPDDVDQTAAMLSSLIIVDNFKSVSDFMERRDDVPNALGNRIEVDGAHGKNVLLKGGLTITPDPRFVDGSKGKKLSVWILTGGTVPLEGPKATFKYKNTSKKDRSSSSSGSFDEIEGLRRSLAAQVESNYVSNFNTYHDSYLETTLSLIGFMLDNDYCGSVLINRVIPTICFDKTDFYLLFEPYKTNGKYLISNNIISDWFKSKKSYSLGTVINKINKLLNDKTESSLLYSNVPSALNIINECRNKLLKSKFSPTTLSKRIERVYDELFKQNILPDDLVKFYETAQRKMYTDEFRFVIFQMFMRLENSISFNRHSYDKILNIISGYMGDTGGELKPLLLRNNISMGIPPVEKIAEIKIFINSSMFFYIPISFENMKNYPHEFILTKPDPNGIYFIYNITEILHRRCKKFAEQLPKAEDIKQTLMKLKKEGKLDEYIKNLTDE